tara:strand:- start:52 stop:345 length:294 start_codon:yes stop_codon:yes gene_type:complete
VGPFVCLVSVKSPTRLLLLLRSLLLPLGGTLWALLLLGVGVEPPTHGGAEPPLSPTVRLPASTATPRPALLTILLLTTETPSWVLLIVRATSTSFNS